MARLWTLLILIGCLTPSAELPRVDIPLIDKWTHVVLFGIFSFLWLCAKPVLTTKWVMSLLIISVAFGAAVEILQGTLTFLGRSAEFMDAVADGLGGIVGVAVFLLMAYLTKSGSSPT
jgi:VanZ family protein